MKNIFYALMITLLLAPLAANGQKDRRLTNGFSMNAMVGIPSSDYGHWEGVGSAYEYGSLFGFQLGNRYYFNPKNNYGFGLMVGWVDFSTAYKKATGNLGEPDVSRVTMDVSLLRLGPVGTLAIGDNMAIDLYYNLRPTVMITGWVESDPTGTIDDQTYAYGGFGVTHALGAAYRISSFNIGLEYVTGKVNCNGTYSGPNDLDLPNEKISTSSLRFLVGVKF